MNGNTDNGKDEKSEDSNDNQESINDDDIEILKKRNDSHNKRDKAGNYPSHDVAGKAYTHICGECGKGFFTGAALGGHRSNHVRMEKMGKIYNKKTGKHEYAEGYNKNKK